MGEKNHLSQNQSKREAKNKMLVNRKSNCEKLNIEHRAKDVNNYY